MAELAKGRQSEAGGDRKSQEYKQTACGKSATSDIQLARKKAADNKSRGQAAKATGASHQHQKADSQVPADLQEPAKNKNESREKESARWG